MDKVKNLGQVFTQEREVLLMKSLIRNSGKVLEPSCGNGAFSSMLDNVTSIEYDKSVCPEYAINMDFFDYSTDNKFDTIIGNPPYVAFKDIMDETKSKLDLQNFDRRTNLFLFFVEKCVKHLNNNGEIIFLTPREFIKQTSAIHLNNMLHELGTFTHFYDYGDEMLFKGFNPNCAIWRFELGNHSHRTELLCKKTVRQQNINGQIVFSNTNYDYNLSDLFDVRVGGVSGLDSLFVNSGGNKDFVYSKTATTGKTRRMFYNIQNNFLLQHKDTLINRKIKKFTEDDWWKWGRDYHKTETDRIYVNCKTRNKSPFFHHECKNYDGSVMALFFKDNNIDVQKCVDIMNRINWDELGFKVGGRYSFNQRALQNIKLPTKIVQKMLKEAKNES